MTRFCQGFGFLAPLSIIISIFIIANLINSIAHCNPFALYQHLGEALGCFFAGGICWAIGRKLNKRKYGETLHGFFFIPFEYWFYVSVIIGFSFLFSNYWH